MKLAVNGRPVVYENDTFSVCSQEEGVTCEGVTLILRSVGQIQVGGNVTMVLASDDGK